MLFALAGFLIGGADDLVIDAIWFWRLAWQRLVIERRHARMQADDMPLSPRPGSIALFVPAWDESNVIAPMLRGCINAWPRADVMIFVGAYRNDPATIAAIARVAEMDARIRLVVTDHDGPTTKADCLNMLWGAMLREEAHRGHRFKAMVLHDAEDVVHPDEMRLFDYFIDRFDLVQLPVLPLVSQRSRWVAGHYCDEFAEAHGKLLRVREIVGAAIPSAGVGCAFDRDLVGAIAAAQGGRPFDPVCLTEDYELGLKVTEAGGKGVFLTLRDGAGELVCTREYFPDTLDAAVRQKARWATGIALAGWDRMGWSGSMAETWMRLRDRRAPVAALVILLGYAALLLQAVLWAARIFLPLPPQQWSAATMVMLDVSATLLLWRLAMRVGFVAYLYDWREGVRALPRAVLANLIAILAARRAITAYLASWRGTPLRWDKTEHRFPTEAEA